MFKRQTPGWYASILGIRSWQDAIRTRPSTLLSKELSDELAQLLYRPEKISKDLPDPDIHFPLDPEDPVAKEIKLSEAKAILERAPKSEQRDEKIREIDLELDNVAAEIDRISRAEYSLRQQLGEKIEEISTREQEKQDLLQEQERRIVLDEYREIIQYHSKDNNIMPNSEFLYIEVNGVNDIVHMRATTNQDSVLATKPAGETRESKSFLDRDEIDELHRTLLSAGVKSKTNYRTGTRIGNYFEKHYNQAGIPLAPRKYFFRIGMLSGSKLEEMLEDAHKLIKQGTLSIKPLK